MKAFRTATMSHSDIREALYTALRLARVDVGFLIDVWDTHCIYVTWDQTENQHLWKQAYTLGADDTVTLVDDPIEVQPAFVKKGTVEVVASKMVAGVAASKVLAQLKTSNPLIAAIDGTSNAHLVVMDLTTIGKASQHQGDTQYLLEKAGLKAAANSLISKPIHVTQKFDGHVDAGSAPVAIGTFLGFIPIENDDDTITFRTVASLWNTDFPEIVDEIQKTADKLGASYEIAYNPETAKRHGSVMHIHDYEFSGGAILFQSAAAHPETKVIHAEQVTIADVDAKIQQISPADREALRERILAHAVAAGDAWAMPTNTKLKGGGTMKYPGIPDTLEALVETLISKELQAATGTLIAEKQKADEALAAKAADLVARAAELEKLKAEAVTSGNTLSELTVKVDALTKELGAATTALTEFQTAKAVADEKALIDAEWDKLQKNWGLPDELRAAREPLLKKLIAGTEKLTIEEYQQLTAGGRVANGVRPVPLMAGTGDGSRTATPDPEALKRTFPASQFAGKKIW